MIRVLVASGSAALKETLENTIRSSSLLEYAGALDLAYLSSPGFSWSELNGDVLLAEIESASRTGWKVYTDLPLPVLALIDPVDLAMTGAILRAGFRGAIFSEATRQEMEGAVQAVHAGLLVTTVASLQELLPELPPSPDELVEPLSERELEVLEMLAEGLSNKLVGQALSISEHTVKTHVGSIFAKLGVSSRTEAVSQAVRRGLVML